MLTWTYIYDLHKYKESLLYGKSSSGGCILRSHMQSYISITAHEVLAEKMKAHSNSVIAQNCQLGVGK